MFVKVDSDIWGLVWFFEVEEEYVIVDDDLGWYED